MNPKQFLTIGGIVLVLVGILGFVGVLGPSAEQSIFGGVWYFDNAENWAHLLIGIVALIATYTLKGGTQKGLVMIVGIVAILVAILNIFTTTLGAANLERPLDLLLHLAIGIWALMSAKGGKMAMASQPMGGGAPMPR